MKSGPNRKKRSDAGVIRMTYKDAPLEKAIALVNQQINLLMEAARKNGLLDARYADILIKYTKLLTDLQTDKFNETKKIKKLTPLEAKEILEKELS